MYRIQTLNKISPAGLQQLPADDYSISQEMERPEIILLRSFNMLEMALPDTLLAVARAGAGVNNIPVSRCSDKGIVVFNTPGANANAVKELTLAALLFASRDILPGVEFCASLRGKGAEVPALVEKNKSRFAGGEIQGKTLGVVGLGKIGVAVANAALNLGMAVIGFDPFISVESAWGLSSAVGRAVSLEWLLEHSDYVSLHMPLNDATKGLLQAERFARMKKGACLLNFSRAAIVDTSALLQAIDGGIVHRYVTDFPEDDLLGRPHIIPIPHLGASTEEAEINCAVMAVQQAKNFLEKGHIKNAVNYPDCELEQSAAFRLLVMNKNIPNMVGQVSTALAKANINISEMLNKSRGDNACSLIDIGQRPSPAILQALGMIEGVRRVRLIEFTQS